MADDEAKKTTQSTPKNKTNYRYHRRAPRKAATAKNVTANVAANAADAPDTHPAEKPQTVKNADVQGQAKATRNNASPANRPANRTGKPKPRQKNAANANKAVSQPAPQSTLAKQPVQPGQSRSAKPQSAKSQSAKRTPLAGRTQNIRHTPANPIEKLQPPTTVATEKRPRKPHQPVGKGSDIPVRIIPLGGLGEVGKNMTLYECQGDMFLVDCGSLFPDAEMLGVDLVIPDFGYAVQNASKIKGIVITHGHEDHIGALPYLLKQCKVPVYGTLLTLGLIKNKLTEHNLLGDVELRLINPGEKFRLGCFEIDPLRVNHSIPDAIALAISCPAGIILQTGDFKIDYTPVSDKPINLAEFAAYGQKGVLALLSDSTNAERPGFSNSERVVGQSFEVLFGRAENKRIIIATFASNIQRIQQIFNMAVKYGRKVAVSGRSMINNINMALELGYLQAPETLIIDIENLNKYPPEQLVVVTTGSQGEPLSALSRMSGGMHRNVHIGVGDFVIFSSKPIPGNEKMVGKVVNSLLKQGADVIYESMYDVHTSGHACQEELKLMLSLVRPKYFIPVHGEFKQLKKHADLGLAVGVPPENIHIPDIGECICLSEKTLKLEASVPSGKTLVDGLGIGDVGSVVLRDRQHLSQDGLVIVVATVDSVSGELLSGPDIVSRGFVYVKESEDLIDEAKRCVNDVLYACWAEDMRNWADVKTRIREEVSQLLYQRTKRNPMVLPILMEV